MGVDEEVERITKKAIEREDAGRKRQAEMVKAMKAVEGKRQAFMREAVRAPVEEIVNKLSAKGFQGTVSDARSDPDSYIVVGSVNHYRFLSRVRFERDSPASIEFERSPAATGETSGPVRGQTAQQVKDKVSNEFLRYLDQVL